MRRGDRVMRRRKFITLLGGAAACPVVARAQQTERMRRIGVLLPASANDNAFQDRIGAFLQGLQQLGWSIGRNVRVDIRWASNDPTEIRRHAAELAGLAPDVVVAFAASTVGAMLQATRSVPVVFAGVADPVAAGFVDSLARPGAQPVSSCPNMAWPENCLSCSRRSRPASRERASFGIPRPPAAPPSSVSFKPPARRSGWR